MNSGRRSSTGQQCVQITGRTTEGGGSSTPPSAGTDGTASGPSPPGHDEHRALSRGCCHSSDGLQRRSTDLNPNFNPSFATVISVNHTLYESEGCGHALQTVVWHRAFVGDIGVGKQSDCTHCRWLAKFALSIHCCLSAKPEGDVETAGSCHLVLGFNGNSTAKAVMPPRPVNFGSRPSPAIPIRRGNFK